MSLKCAHAAMVISAMTSISLAASGQSTAPQPTYAPPNYAPPPVYAAPTYASPPYGQPGAPPTGYPQYGSPTPHFAYPPEMPYRNGEQVLSGYHLEERPRKGLVIAGASVLGAFYAPSFLIGVSSEQSYLKWLMVPVAGPWVAMATRPRCDTSDFSCVGVVFGNIALAFDGIAQVTGLTLLTVGFAAPKMMQVRDGRREDLQAKTTWTLRPTAIGAMGFGLSLGGALL